MDKLKLLTKRFKFDFDKKDECLNEISFEDLESSLEQGESINKRPLIVKNTDGYLVLTFQIEVKSSGIGFPASAKQRKK